MVKKLVLAAVALLAITTGALAVSVGELVKNCGDDSKAYCEGVGYGDAMTECLVQHRAELQPQCKLIVDRIEGGEKVSLFQVHHATDLVSTDEEIGKRQAHEIIYG